ncbi:MAG: MarR family winged helix-turn-helix transcriptional regulator [Candidatus Dormibacteraceae bacterium]
MALTRLWARLRAESSAFATGWSIPQLSTLARIIDHGEITASALAQAEHVRPQSVAGTLGVLKASGLIASRQDPTDGRKLLIGATDDGRRLVKSISASREAWLTQVMEAVLDPDERRELKRAIDLLNRLSECHVRSAEGAGGRP